MVDLKTLYGFTNQRDPDRILNRLKRLEANVPRLKGGKLVSVRSARTLPKNRIAAEASKLGDAGNGNRTD